MTTTPSPKGAKTNGDLKSKTQSLNYIAMEIAQGLLETDAKEIEAIQQMAEWFPPLRNLVQHARGWGWRGKAPKKWVRFWTKIYPLYQLVAISGYEMFVEDEQPEDTYGNDLKINTKKPLSQRVWEFMGDTFPDIREQVIAKFYEMLPEFKVQVELDTRSDEKKTFLHGITTQDAEYKGGKTSTKMKRVLEQLQFQDGDDDE